MEITGSIVSICDYSFRTEAYGKSYVYYNAPKRFINLCDPGSVEQIMRALGAPPRRTLLNFVRYYWWWLRVPTSLPW